MSDIDANARTQIEEVAALGYLLNAIAHDLNNQLTNLLLGADQAQYGGDREAIELVVQQAQKLTEITRAVQALGQANMDRGKGVVDLLDVARDAARWNDAAGRAMAGVEGESTPVRGSAHHLSFAVALLLRWAEAEASGPLRLRTSVRQVPRSAWSGSSETVPMASLDILVGDGGDEPRADFKALVDDFFGARRSPEEVGVMAAWEVLRKVRGRLSVCGSDGGLAVRILLPPAEPA